VNLWILIIHLFAGSDVAFQYTPMKLASPVIGIRCRSWRKKSCLALVFSDSALVYGVNMPFGWYGQWVISSDCPADARPDWLQWYGPSTNSHDVGSDKPYHRSQSMLSYHILATWFGSWKSPGRLSLHPH